MKEWRGEGHRKEETGRERQKWENEGLEGDRRAGGRQEGGKTWESMERYLQRKREGDRKKEKGRMGVIKA
jgi:hypothetical protein